MAIEERRRFVRLPAHLSATYTVLGSRPHRASLTRNAGGGGIGFFTDAKLTKGLVLQVDVKFPTRPRPVTFTAEVVWSGKLILERGGEAPRAFETGVRFLDIAPDDQTFIVQYSVSGLPPASPAA